MYCLQTALIPSTTSFPCPGVSAPGHGKEVVDVLNVVDKLYIYQLMSTVQLTGSVRFDSQIKMHTGTKK